MFFAAVVVAGNALLAAVYTAPPARMEADGPSDYMTRKVRRVRRAIEQLRVLWTEVREPESALPPSDEPAPRKAEGRVEAFAYDLIPEPVLNDDPKPDAAPRRVERILASDFDVAAHREFVREQWEAWSLANSHGFMESLLDDVFRVPACLCDGAVRTLRCWFPQSGCYSLTQEDETPLVLRLVSLREPGRMNSPFREFAMRWAEREAKQLGGDSYLRTFGVEEGLEEPSAHDILHEQEKVLWDVVRKVYLSRYSVRGEARLRDDLWRFGEWKPLDILVLPAVVVAYTWYRGFERRISFAGTRLTLKVEPLKEIYRDYRRNGNEVSAAGFEWEIPGFPLKLIVSTGITEGKYGFDFIGIGTSLGEAKKALTQLE